MRWLIIALASLLVAGGCSSRKSSLLLERRTRGEIDEAIDAAKAVKWKFDPALMTLENAGVQVHVNHASWDYLVNFFGNQRIFGENAGKPPYFPEHLVFYIKVANLSDKKIRIQPADFVLLDDRGNQYSPIGTDYVTAYQEFRSGMRGATRGLLENASPGYMGIDIPIGRVLVSKSQASFALLQQSSLQGGYIYPGVVHDGLVAFWNPIPTASKFRLLITNIKSDFDANDDARQSIEIPFEFNVSKE